MSPAAIVTLIFLNRLLVPTKSLTLLVLFYNHSLIHFFVYDIIQIRLTNLLYDGQIFLIISNLKKSMGN